MVFGGGLSLEQDMSHVVDIICNPSSERIQSNGLSTILNAFLFYFLTNGFNSHQQMARGFFKVI